MHRYCVNVRYIGPRIMLRRFSSAKTMEETDCAIIGGGVGAASTAFHLAKSTNLRIKVIEAGKIGYGLPQNEYVSGTAVPDANTWALGSVRKASSAMQSRLGLTAKMMLGSFPTSAQEFRQLHGHEGAVLAHEISSIGLKLQKQLARAVLPHSATQMRELGTMYLATKNEAASIEEDYNIWRKLGANVRLVDQDELGSMPGVTTGAVKGLFFPDDAIINSSLYASSLLRAAGPRVSVLENTSVTEIKERKSRRGKPGYVTLQTENGNRIRARFAVVATGGFMSQMLDVAPYIKPCWSYLVTMPFAHLNELQQQQKQQRSANNSVPECSPNFLQFCQAPYDWAVIDGVLRLSGEDRHSAFEEPRAAERFAALKSWATQHFPQLSQPGTVNDEPNAELFGVYSETPDLLPLVGKFSRDSNVAYLVGCNAIGQATLSFGAALLPGILGLRPLTSVEKTLAGFLSPMRSSLRPVAIGKAF